MSVIVYDSLLWLGLELCMLYYVLTSRVPFFSDDDEFFDRTKKKSSNQPSNGQQSVETADSLLEKKDIITSDMEGKKKLLEEEKNKLAQRHDADLGDDLDAYMSGLSSQLGIAL